MTDNLPSVKDPHVAIYPTLEGHTDYEQNIINAVAKVGMTTVLELFANGMTQTRIASRLGITGSGLWRYFNRYGEDGGPVEKAKLAKRALLWNDAKLRKADTLAEEVLDIADEAEETKEGIAKARLRSDVRRWRAGTLSDEYKQQSGTQVQVNIGSAFLESLKKHGGADGLPSKQDSIPDAEYVIEKESLLPSAVPTTEGQR